jgi:hypothetical protein
MKSLFRPHRCVLFAIGCLLSPLLTSCIFAELRGEESRIQIGNFSGDSTEVLCGVYVLNPEQKWEALLDTLPGALDSIDSLASQGVLANGQWSIPKNMHALGVTQRWTKICELPSGKVRTLTESLRLSPGSWRWIWKGSFWEAQSAD